MSDTGFRPAGLSIVAAEGVLRRKIGDWLMSIDDEPLRKYVANKIVVAGGSIASMLLGEKVNDFDVYLTSRDAAIRLAFYYVKRFANNPRADFGGGALWVEVLKSGTDFGHRGRSVEVNADGVMYLAKRKNTPEDEIEYVAGPKCPETAVPSKEGRVNIVVKSSGAISEAPAPEDSTRYFLIPSSGEAWGAESASMLTSALGLDAEAALASQLCDVDPSDAYNEPPELKELTEATEKAVEPPKQTGPGAKAKNRYRPVFLSSNAITLSDGIQIVIRFHGEPSEIIANFDFVHTTCYWTSKSGKVVVNEAALLSLLNRKLKYVGSRYPLCSLVRTRKFVARGWKAPASVYVKAMFQCTKLNWNNLSTWEDQLTGMDAAYFSHILSILEHDRQAGVSIDGNYVVELIDRMM